MQSILEQTKQYWDFPSRGNYHEIVSLVISRKITFTMSRQIRSNLYTLFGTNIFTFEHFNNTDINELYRTGLTSEQLRVIRSIDRDVTYSNLELINGIGKWTIKGYLIKCYPEYYPDIFLFEDKWIRDNVCIIFNNSKLTQKQIENVAATYWCGFRTAMSRFLWRLNKKGASKIKNGIFILDSTDFVN